MHSCNLCSIELNYHVYWCPENMLAYKSRCFWKYSRRFVKFRPAIACYRLRSLSDVLQLNFAWCSTTAMQTLFSSWKLQVQIFLYFTSWSQRGGAITSQDNVIDLARLYGKSTAKMSATFFTPSEVSKYIKQLKGNGSSLIVLYGMHCQ